MFNLSSIGRTAVLGLATLTPSFAVADPLSGSGAYIENATAQCTALTCNVNFSAVPEQTSLIVRDVSCRVQAASTALFIDHFLSGNNRRTQLLVGTKQKVGSVTIYWIHDAAYALYDEGMAPNIRVSFDTSGLITANCTIGGELIDDVV